MVTFDEDRQDERIKTLREREEEELASALSSKFGIPYLDLTITPINIDALRILKEEEARDAGLAIFDLTDKRISVAVLSPELEKTKEAVALLKERGYTPSLYLVSHLSLEKVYERYKDLSFSFETK